MSSRDLASPVTLLWDCSNLSNVPLRYGARTALGALTRAERGGPESALVLVSTLAVG